LLDEIKPLLEEQAGQARFNGNSTLRRILPLLTKHKAALLVSIEGKLGASLYRCVMMSLLRNAFLVELVNDDISSTKMENRWIEKESGGKKQEVFNDSDPRFSSFEDCAQIFDKLLAELDPPNLTEERKRLLSLYQQFSLLPYELPLDYDHLPTETSTQIHKADNYNWLWDDRYQTTLKLREILLDPQQSAPHQKFFSSILKDKIKVKTYLTDRVQTGVHKTNREKRWEVHPKSVHFALRRSCLEIEKELVTQLCHFKDFPQDIFKKLADKGLLNEEPVFKCPITLEPLCFEDMRKEVETPFHGISKFPVGHLTPLKSHGKHVPSNVSWFSADGNRIQGSLSVEETRKLLANIVGNYSVAKIKLGS